MGYLYDHDASAPLSPSPAEHREQRIAALEAGGMRLCARPGAPPTDADLDVAEWFAAWLKAPGRVPFTGCPQCERVTSLDLEPGQVASCGAHSYVRRGEPRE